MSYPQPEGQRDFCGSGLVSRKGCAAAPAIHAFALKSWGCCAALSRHKAAPTKPEAQPEVASSGGFISGL
ncbi:hypothetical protein B8W72_11330 [Pseudomonas putida]|uniref:Uncharacterized protein n=1 Tax=Pseudomonas putida TaxID=303 RepID=A0A1Y3L7X3_PSEPU|nr:hypothetical protein B8W72_11330 [Pseudomonas putida]